MFSNEKEKTQKQIAVMAAFTNGKKIECRERTGEKWCRIPAPAWDWLNYDYRVEAAKPQRVWLAPLRLSTGLVQYAKQSEDWRPDRVEFIEVTPDVEAALRDGGVL